MRARASLAQEVAQGRSAFAFRRSGSARIGVILSLLSIALEGCARVTAQSPDVDLDSVRAPARVEGRAVRSREFRGTHIFYSVIRPSRRARLSFVDGGRMISRAVEVGDAVREGQVIAHLDPRGYRNAVAAARASAEELELRREQLSRDHERASALMAGGVSTPAELEQVGSGLERVRALRVAAQAQLGESRRRHRETVLRAPFDGIITDTMVESGELVAAGQWVIRVASLEAFEVQLEVPPRLASDLHVGDEVTLTAIGADGDPGSRSAISGHIRSVARSAAEITGHYPVLVALDPGADVGAGIGVEATLRGATREVLSVPLSAVVDPSGRRPFVWKIAGGHALRAWIRLGNLRGDQVEVREGLSLGERVVVRGQVALLEGDRVQDMIEDADGTKESPGS